MLRNKFCFSRVVKGETIDTWAKRVNLTNRSSGRCMMQVKKKGEDIG